MGRGESARGKSARGQSARDLAAVVIPRLADPATASPDERDEHLMLLEAARQLLEVEWTETLAAADRAGDHHLTGYPSMVAYLKDRLSMAGGRAHRYVRNARAAARFGATFSAWKHRHISGDEAELMFRASERMPEEYTEAEALLLEAVGDGVDDTRKILDYWRCRVDRAAAFIELEEQLERRRCSVSRTTYGMVIGAFALPALEGETFLCALDALMPPPIEGDGRSAVQRRADALGDLARSFLDGSETPVAGGERPHLTVHVGLPTLLDLAGDLHETEDGVVMDPALVGQIACDSSVSRVIFGPKSEVLDVGRRTRVVPAGLRRAVVARDRHCVAPGCRRSARWCDVHHMLPWSEGGETTLDNLCLLCRYHHTLLHLELLGLADLEVGVPACVGSKRSS